MTDRLRRASYIPPPSDEEYHAQFVRSHPLLSADLRRLVELGRTPSQIDLDLVLAGYADPVCAASRREATWWQEHPQ